MESKYIYLIVGILIGWITKFPLLLKWYRELKETKDYKERKLQVHIKELEVYINKNKMDGNK